MKVLCVGYREWALQIYNNLKKIKKLNVIIHNQKKNLESTIKKEQPNIILFYGWSWIIKDSIIRQYNCFMLHPSPLPKYRGGSPIQNQIIRGENISAVTIFKMNDILDGGDIYYQHKISLKGTLNDILKRIILYGTKGTVKLLTSKKIKIKKQDNKIASFFKRRKPDQSEITIKELRSASSAYLYNKIRMLDDPYPNAYIKLKDGKKLYIKKFDIK